MQLDREGLRLGQDQPRQDSQEGLLGRDGNRVKAGVIKGRQPSRERTFKHREQQEQWLG